VEGREDYLKWRRKVIESQMDVSDNWIFEMQYMW